MTEAGQIAALRAALTAIERRATAAVGYDERGALQVIARDSKTALAAAPAQPQCPVCKGAGTITQGGVAGIPCVCVPLDAPATPSRHAAPASPIVPCCACGYNGEEETACPKRKDGLHCNCWYDSGGEIDG